MMQIEPEAICLDVLDELKINLKFTNEQKSQILEFGKKQSFSEMFQRLFDK